MSKECNNFFLTYPTLSLSITNVIFYLSLSEDLASFTFTVLHTFNFIHLHLQYVYTSFHEAFFHIYFLLCESFWLRSCCYKGTQFIIIVYYLSLRPHSSFTENELNSSPTNCYFSCLYFCRISQLGSVLYKMNLFVLSIPFWGNDIMPIFRWKSDVSENEEQKYLFNTVWGTWDKVFWMLSVL